MTKTTINNPFGRQCAAWAAANPDTMGIYPKLDRATMTITGTVPFHSGMPRRTSLSKDRTRFYSVEAQQEKVEIIDIAARKTLDSFSLSEGTRKVRIKTLEPDPLHRFVMMVVRPVVKHPDHWEIEPSTLIQRTWIC